VLGPQARSRGAEPALTARLFERTGADDKRRATRPHLVRERSDRGRVDKDPRSALAGYPDGRGHRRIRDLELHNADVPRGQVAEPGFDSV